MNAKSFKSIWLVYKLEVHCWVISSVKRMFMSTLIVQRIKKERKQAGNFRTENNERKIR